MDCDYLHQGKCIWASRICNKLVDANRSGCNSCLYSQSKKHYKEHDAALPYGVIMQCIKEPHKGMTISEMSEWVKGVTFKFKKIDMETWLNNNNQTIQSIKNEKELEDLVVTSIYPKTNQDLVNSALVLGGKLKELGFTGVVGIPRSGLLPAAIIATNYGLALYSVNEYGKIVRLSTGSRGSNIKNDNVKLVAVDDTTASGNSAKEFYEKHGIPVAVCFAMPRGIKVGKIITSSEILENPHILEWNFFGSFWLKNSYFDIDGVLSPNVPAEVDQDEAEYRKWLSCVSPIFKNMPHFFKVKRLVTGRFEKYRSLTEEWLEKHGIQYDELTMFPDEREQDRKNNHHKAVGEWKGELFAGDSDAHFFIESELAEAKIIHQKAKFKHVICTNGGHDFMITNY